MRGEVFPQRWKMGDGVMVDEQKKTNEQRNALSLSLPDFLLSEHDLNESQLYYNLQVTLSDLSSLKHQTGQTISLGYSLGCYNLWGSLGPLRETSVSRIRSI